MSWRPRFRNSIATRRVSARYERRMPSSRLTTGGLTKTKYFSPRGAPLRSTSSNGRSDQPLRQLARIGDRRRRTDERRVRTVVRAHARQAPHDVRQVAAEDATIRMQLVDHDEPEILEELRPTRMVRQDARVQHVRVAQHHVRAGAHRAPRVLGRVAVIGEDAELAAAFAPTTCASW